MNHKGSHPCSPEGKGEARIAIFASGSGTNAEQIMLRFQKAWDSIEVVLVLSNKSDAFVLERAKNLVFHQKFSLDNSFARQVRYWVGYKKIV